MQDQGVMASPYGSLLTSTVATTVLKVQIVHWGGERHTVMIGAGIECPISNAGGKMYWADGGKGGMKISRANLDGTTVEDLVTGLYDPYGIALDLESGQIYFNDQVLDKISRTDKLDASRDGGLARRQRVQFNITGGTGVMEGYTRTGTAEDLFDHTTEA